MSRITQQHRNHSRLWIQHPPHFQGVHLAPRAQHKLSGGDTSSVRTENPKSARPRCCDELIIVNKEVDELGTSSR